jgi:predicted DNA-binding transcriptional regulator AlpA
MDNTTGRRILMTTEQAAEYLGLSVSALTKWRHYSIGPDYVKIGPRAIRYHLDDIQAYIEAVAVKTSPGGSHAA